MPDSHSDRHLADAARHPATLAARSGLTLVDCAQLRGLGAGFAFVAEASDYPEGLIAYDTGAKLFAALQEAGLSLGREAKR